LLHIVSANKSLLGEVTYTRGLLCIVNDVDRHVIS
jgi:hypothetical protein